METVSAKSIVTRKKQDGWFGCEYNMNIYRGCNHGCIYCDSRSDCYRNPDFGSVKAKENALGIIRRELAAIRRPGVIATGSMSDPYNPFEKRYELTRGALRLIAEYGFGVAVATKGTLVTRDIDLFVQIGRFMPAMVKLTITTADDTLAAKIEPGAPSTSERFRAMKELSEAGIYTGMLLMPLLPYINDQEENVVELVEKAADAGARFIYAAFGLTQRDGQREYLHRQLDADFPGLSERYRKSFGGNYYCPSPKAGQLEASFEQLCGKKGILYRMSDIIKDYRRPREEQMRLY